MCRTSVRKGRKAKGDDEAAHPALSLNVPTSSEDLESTQVGNTKRRLYNSKYPDILLPSSEQVTLLLLHLQYPRTVHEKKFYFLLKWC